MIRQPDAQYSINTKALARWAAERLSLQTRDDGAIEAASAMTGPPAPTWAARWRFNTM